MFLILFFVFCNSTSQENIMEEGTLKRIFKKFSKNENIASQDYQDSKDQDVLLISKINYISSTDDTKVTKDPIKKSKSLKFPNLRTYKNPKILRRNSLNSENYSKSGVKLLKLTKINEKELDNCKEQQNAYLNEQQFDKPISTTPNDHLQIKEIVDQFLYSYIEIEDLDFNFSNKILSEFKKLKFCDFYSKIKFWTNFLSNFYLQQIPPENEIFEINSKLSNLSMINSFDQDFLFSGIYLLLNNFHIIYDYLQNNPNVLKKMCSININLLNELTRSNDNNVKNVFIRPKMKFKEIEIKRLFNPKIEKIDIFITLVYVKKNDFFKCGKDYIFEYNSITNPSISSDKSLNNYDLGRFCDLVPENKIVKKFNISETNMKIFFPNNCFIISLVDIFNFRITFNNLRSLKINMEIFHFIQDQNMFLNLKELFLYNGSKSFIEISLDKMPIFLKRLDISDFILDISELKNISKFGNLKKFALTLKNENFDEFFDIIDNTQLESIILFSKNNVLETEKSNCMLCYFENLRLLGPLKSIIYLTHKDETCERHLKRVNRNIFKFTATKKHLKKYFYGFHFNYSSNDENIFDELKNFNVYEIELFNLSLNLEMINQLGLLISLERIKFTNCKMSECTFYNFFSKPNVSEMIKMISFENTEVSESFFEPEIENNYKSKSMIHKLKFKNLEKLCFYNYISTNDICLILCYFDNLKKRTINFYNCNIDEEICEMANLIDKRYLMFIDL
ncbi:hypothetical protein DMUE_3139 [Dictyocoela muelleri]|nr:hypothetical protein DMUE_3139 [Dictyocoela muelleri]